MDMSQFLEVSKSTKQELINVCHIYIYIYLLYIIVFADVGQEKTHSTLFNATFTFISARVFR